MDFYYINHNGKRVDLSDCPYLFQQGDILDWEYEYDSSSGIRNKVSNFRKGIKEFSVKLAVMCDFTIPFEEREEEWKKAVNYLMEVFEEDVLDNQEGKLYSSTGYYMNCMIIGSEKSDWKMGLPIMFNTLKILAKTPVWIKDNLFHFETSSGNVGSGKKYAYKYAYLYGGDLTNTSIINPSFYESDFLLTEYGPVLNPLVYIGGIPYLVSTDLKEGERLEINSMQGTVIKIRANGDQDNMFHYRQKQPSVFTKIKPGRQEIRWPGSFPFDLTLFERRSESAW